MKRTKITDKITYVEPDSMANFTSCAGIIVQSKKKVLIDMNMGAKETPGLIEQEKPDVAIITHYHLDHSIWTRHVNACSDAVVFIPKKEEPYLTSLDFVIEHTSGPFGMSEKWKDFVENRLKYKPLKAYECYNEKTSLKDMAPEIVLVETPGHSPAHTSFYFPGEKILFSGDIGLDRFGPWYGWADCSINQLVESILRLDGMDVKLILSSHGGVHKKEIGSAWAKCIHQILQREQKIKTKLEAGISKEDIIEQGVFYPDKEKIKEPLKSFLNMWDTAMYNHHEALINEGGLIKFFPQIMGMLKG
ncbi:MAG: MBL fold metallo-hydrolase [Desulfobacula sp.]|nr:MBL fold metallo-hydrolase [Desulfobacula sp.]